MNKILILLLAPLFLSCGGNKSETVEESSNDQISAKSPQELGKELFEGVGNCFACHKSDQKIVGPSIQEIAKIYNAQNGDMVNFLKGNGKPIVDPSQYEVMKANFAITKTMTDEELEALEAYMYSFVK